ncbi:MAG: UDP-N-acetylmuramoyl-L-alanyl-D-glutamate--2,6-diaminopimelate ligase [Defluviitaleaceae bacterium]|nr:UDP-N-acetylmuramoyl-L-alanyl-D-glutamate--2,6-diaminopimelate ligase [Defluviitaleaceae bacterium]
MKLTELLKDFEYELFGEDVEINHLTIDSRNVRKNTLFICIEGFRVDGHNFIEEASKAGAVAFIVSKDISVPKGVSVAKVSNSRYAMAFIAHRFYGFDNTSTRLIGITGTNGKTSSAFYMQKVLMEALGGEINNLNEDINTFNNTIKGTKKVGLIGTVDTKINDEQLKIDFATSTTPDSIELMQILSIMSEKGAQNIVMEVTSHALLLHKVENLRFAVSIFTNLTRDHLDLHGTMENYRDAKAKLFAQSDVSVINIDDEYGSFMAKICPKTYTYSVDKESDFKALNLIFTESGSAFDLKIDGKLYNFELPILGKFSVYNALGVIVAAIVLGVEVPIIQHSIKNLNSVPGRIEKVENSLGINLIVDYAHTPDSLISIINTALEFTKGRVITVFGCGGDRDKTKRPIMGKISAENSNLTIITSDNPRTEDPLQILKDIEAGIEKGEYVLIEDREEAIKFAINNAKKGDTVIIAGKGHENYQIFKDKTIEFDDAEVARQILGHCKK